jgi:crotonobetainyl-CoA:carnitine CoA-transferase CaiB-like acyl-CoA transferase
MVLADLGATVVHIDPPTGPQWKHQANAILNRNKSCISVDLKTPQGVDQAMQLIDQADVVIESFRSGVMQRLGIDFAQLRETVRNLLRYRYRDLPAMISCAVSGKPPRRWLPLPLVRLPIWALTAY